MAAAKTTGPKRQQLQPPERPCENGETRVATFFPMLGMSARADTLFEFSSNALSARADSSSPIAYAVISS
jgi:hypothetical protein